MVTLVLSLLRSKATYFSLGRYGQLPPLGPNDDPHSFHSECHSKVVSVLPSVR